MNAALAGWFHDLLNGWHTQTVWFIGRMIHRTDCGNIDRKWANERKSCVCVKGTNCIVWRAWMRYVYESTLMKGWKMWMKWIKWVKNHTRTVPSKNRKKSNTKYWMQDWTKSLAELDATHDMNVMNEVTEMSWMGWSPEGNEPSAKNTENRRI